MNTAEIIDVSGSQAIKLPAEFHFDSDIVSIRREGNAVVIESLAGATAMPAEWPENFFASIRIDDPAFERPDQGTMPPSPLLD